MRQCCSSLRTASAWKSNTHAARTNTNNPRSLHLLSYTDHNINRRQMFSRKVP